MNWMAKLRLLFGLLLLVVVSHAAAAPHLRDGQRAAPHRQPPQDFRRDAPPDRPLRRDQDGADDARRAQRLTPEERRQLRRDIHDAGRELYPRRR